MGTATTPSYRFHIVVALDRSQYSEIVLEHAIDQAARHDSPDLHFVTVVGRPDAAEEAKTWLATQVLQGLEAFGKDGPDWRSRVHVLVGEVADELASFAADVRADLVVIGRFGSHDWRRSTADRMLERAICPTLVVGLTEHTVDAHPQCAACVEVRQETDGERWFCSEHADSARSRLTTLLTPSLSLTHGGPLW